MAISSLIRPEDDIEYIRAIASVPVILDVVANVTHMGFTAIARVTEDRWITCASRDDLAFGLKPGDELKVETTICHEIRQKPKPVVIDDVLADPVYVGHHTPAMYGFRSYISVPIILGDGSFFGTLCAIDPKPRDLNNPTVIGMFEAFAELLAFHLDKATRLATGKAGLEMKRIKFEQDAADYELISKLATEPQRREKFAEFSKQFHEMGEQVDAILGQPAEEPH